MSEAFHVSSKVTPSTRASAAQDAERDKLARQAEDAAKRNTKRDRDARAAIVADEKAAREEEKLPEPGDFIREDISDLLVEVAGVRILLAPPKGSPQISISRIYGGNAVASAEFRLTKSLLFVREVDGDPVSPILNLVDRDFLANQLGDVVLNGIIHVVYEHWPPTLVTEIKVLKKNLRG